MNCSSIPDYTHTLDLVVALGGIPSAFFFLFPTDYPVNYQSAKSKVMNNKKENEGQTDFSYYGLYLLDYLRTNKFEQADDTAFIRERAYYFTGRVFEEIMCFFFCFKSFQGYS